MPALLHCSFTKFIFLSVPVYSIPVLVVSNKSVVIRIQQNNADLNLFSLHLLPFFFLVSRCYNFFLEKLIFVAFFLSNLTCDNRDIISINAPARNVQLQNISLLLHYMLGSNRCYENL
jgi:hypothetical protein